MEDHAECAYVSALASLVDDTCMWRSSSLDSSRSLLPQIPIYVLSVPRLVARRAAMAQRLEAAMAHDVTWVDCANREDVVRFSPALRRCLHPEYIPHPWSRRPSVLPSGPSTALWAMANGTLSLQLKHQLAIWDSMRRKLPSALVLEDDATVRPVYGCSWPPTIHFQRTSTSFTSVLTRRRADISTLSSEPLVRTSRGNSSHNGRGAIGSAPVHRRTNGSPLLVGSNAYIIFAKAMEALLTPVRAEADVSLSLLDAPKQCQVQRGTLGMAPDVKLCGRLRAPPRHQYGPAYWIVGQDLRGLEQKTHLDPVAATKSKN